MEHKQAILVYISFILISAGVSGVIANVLNRKTNPIDDNGLASLLNASMTNYLDWLRSNNLDPTPPNDIANPVFTEHPSFTIIYVTENEQLVGYTNQSNNWNVTEITTRFAEREFSIGIKSKGKLRLEGTYTAIGVTSDGQQIQGEGRWQVQTTGTLTERYTFGFEVLNDRISLIWRPNAVENSIKLNETETQFEGLWNNLTKPYPVEIRRQVTWDVTDRFNKWYEGHPTRRLLHEYLTHVFQNIKQK